MATRSNDQRETGKRAPGQVSNALVWETPLTPANYRFESVKAVNSPPVINETHASSSRTDKTPSSRPRNFVSRVVLGPSQAANPPPSAKDTLAVCLSRNELPSNSGPAHQTSSSPPSCQPSASNSSSPPRSILRRPTADFDSPRQNQRPSESLKSAVTFQEIHLANCPKCQQGVEIRITLTTSDVQSVAFEKKAEAEVEADAGQSGDSVAEVGNDYHCAYCGMALSLTFTVLNVKRPGGWNVVTNVRLFPAAGNRLRALKRKVCNF